MFDESLELPKSGWHNETTTHTERVQSFFSKYVASFEADSVHQRYDGMNELHFSGTNRALLSRIWEGTAKIISVNLLYEKGVPVQVHIVFDSEGDGQHLDVYFTGKALKDYLEI